MNKAKTILTLKKMQEEGEKIVWSTCYDYPGAHALERAGIDMILVGDSGIMCQFGEKDTLPATMEDQIAMTKAVKRGAPNTFIVGDMPFGSYEVSDEEAVRNAIRMVKETGCNAVKLEGGLRMKSRIEAITRAGIIVIGHLGLTPQSSNSMGGYKLQANSTEAIAELYEDISVMSHLVPIILLEAIPENVARVMNDNTDCILMGIGAGRHVDGQLLIYHDVLGLYPDFKPKFARNFWTFTEQCDTMLEQIEKTFCRYVSSVKDGTFPNSEEVYHGQSAFRGEAGLELITGFISTL